MIVRTLTALRRLLVHEVLLYTSTVRWIARRGPHAVGTGATALPYAAEQAFLMYTMIFVSVIETVVLALVIPWPVVHLILLVLGIWSIFFAVGLHASCVVRPHVLEADGSLRVRYGALVDIRIPAGSIAAVTAQRREGGGMGKAINDGSVVVGVAGQTTLTVELTEPVVYTRPLGRKASTDVVHLHVEDVRTVAALLRSAVAETR
ncbi:hypothetical protein MTQ01_03940 [Streptomyces sp. XM4193]|uniref:hypothetical protein n=1 Tax=Streptomyces sp. XM4193 TaxID=2929782 RepID=UPI001FFAE5D9|nr:hypothetical protein [Streptomyces sp. XM4193]MCK1795172.1 hypothetical protein [Streptomyces sp. XM4193]